MIIDQKVSPPTHQAVYEKVTSMLADSFKIDKSAVDTAQPLTDYGLDSLDAVIVAADMEEWLEVMLPTTLLWDCKNIDEVVEYIIENFSALKRGEEVMVMS